MKRRVYEHRAADRARANAKFQSPVVESFGRSDFEEGVRSLLEKRSPRFARL